MCVETFYNDPLQFLQSNVVLVGGVILASGETSNSVFHFVLQPVQHTDVIDSQGRVIGKVYSLERANSGPGIDAFHCPYEPEKTHFITISHHADYIFTPQMDGCTFGIGNDADGSLIVGHANYASVGRDWMYGNTLTLDPGAVNMAQPKPKIAAARQAQGQKAKLNYYMGWQGNFIEPKDYMKAGDGKATTFGERLENGWRFNTARYKRIGERGARTYLHGGVVTHFKGL